jgi:hypothetical protein
MATPIDDNADAGQQELPPNDCKHYDDDATDTGQQELHPNDCTPSTQYDEDAMETSVDDNAGTGQQELHPNDCTPSEQYDEDAMDMPVDDNASTGQQEFHPIDCNQHDDDVLEVNVVSPSKALHKKFMEAEERGEVVDLSSSQETASYPTPFIAIAMKPCLSSPERKVDSSVERNCVT